MLTKTFGKSRDDRKMGGGGTFPKSHRKKAAAVAGEPKECFSENDMCYGGDGDEDYDQDYDYDYEDDDDDDDDNDDDEDDDGDGADDGVEEQTNGSAAAAAADHCGNSRRVQRNRRRGGGCRREPKVAAVAVGRRRRDKAAAVTEKAVVADQHELSIDNIAAKVPSDQVVDGGSDKLAGDPAKLDLKEE